MKNKNRLSREATKWINNTPEPKQYPDGNPKDAIGRRKVPISLIPSSALIHEAMAFRYGAFEAPCVDGKLGYGPYNWRGAPVSASVYIDAIIRHILDWIDGEEYADDSKAHHLGHARAGLGIILDAAENGTLIDDRPAKGKASEILRRFTKK